MTATETLEQRALLAPLADTVAAGLVTATSAILNGFVNPNGESTDVFFQFSTDPSLPQNIVTSLAGTAGGTGSLDGTGSDAEFDGLTSIAVDTVGNVYVADSGNNTIRKITPDGVVTTLAGSPGMPGELDGTASAARFNGPDAIAVDSAGNLYVADYNGQTIRKVTPLGVVTTLAGMAGVAGHVDATGVNAEFFNPTGIAVDSSGNVFVADSGSRTIRMVTQTGVVTTFAGQAFLLGSTDGIGTSATFAYLGNLAIDTSNNIYVADANGTIRKITPTAVVTTIAGTAGVSGSQDGVGSAAQFYAPTGVAVDNQSNIYVADTFNDTIRKILPGGVVTTLAGVPRVPGSTNAVGRGAKFNGPRGLAVDAAGNVYVADFGNQLVRVLSLPTIPGQTGLTGTTFLPVVAGLFNLTPGQTYYDRVVATNASGSAVGSVNIFQTVNPNTVLQFAASQFTANLVTGTASIVITRSGGLSQGAAVVLSSPGGSSVAAFQRTIDFAPDEQSKTVTIPLLDNGSHSINDENITLKLTSPSTGVRIGSTQTATLVVHDPNAPAVRITSVTFPTMLIGTGKNARRQQVILLQFSGALSGATNLGAYHILAAKTVRVKKKPVTTFQTKVPLISARYNPTTHTVALFTKNKLNLAKLEKLEVNAAAITDGSGLAINNSRNITVVFSKKGVSIQQA